LSKQLLETRSATDTLVHDYIIQPDLNQIGGKISYIYSECLNYVAGFLVKNWQKALGNIG